MGPPPGTLTHEDYTVGWICALPTEMAAARAILDDQHKNLPQHMNDHNTYTLGRIGVHKVVVACLPAGVTGTSSAAAVAAQMLSSFGSIRIGLMVGIGGGVPSGGNDIRLGDVVVSKPTRTFGGVVQYDFGKTVQEGRFERTGSLNKPPPVLLTAVAKLEADHMVEDNKLSEHLSEMVAKHQAMRPCFTYQGTQHDRLFEAEYEHVSDGSTCERCDAGRIKSRPARVRDDPVIHYGLIASGNQVMRHGATRDQLGKEYDILCFEMEAAGLMDNFPCLVIRGICDYADSHKNKSWQKYAAATAAAYTKELLYVISGNQVAATRTAAEATTEAGKSVPTSPADE
jgi:nucleoside phosphorylase